MSMPCTCRYIDRQDFQYIEMDTDSAYMALSAPLESLVRPHLRQEFWEQYGNWFPRPYCDQHKTDFINTKTNESGDSGNVWRPEECCIATQRYDARTPGLFKAEFVGTGAVALNSKTYYCWDADKSYKYSSKGVSKKTTRFLKEDYLRVLRESISLSGTNKGFVVKDNNMYTYTQQRTGLTSLYAKRKVLPDGVNTVNLQI